MFVAKMVTGGHPGHTEYDEENVLFDQKLEKVIDLTTDLRRTFDVFHEESGEKVARVHVDGGVDYTRTV